MRDILLLLVSLYASLVSIRLIPLFVLIAVPLISERLGTWPLPNLGRRTSVNARRALLNALIVLAMATFAGVHTVQVIQHQPQAEARLFPSRAVAFLQRHPSSGHMFNHYDWGGYLIWKLYPRTRVFIDGRADLYGEQLLSRFADTYQLKDDWRQSLHDWDIETVLVPRDAALASGLLNSAGWTVSYQDDQAILLTATSRADSTVLSPGFEASSK